MKNLQSLLSIINVDVDVDVEIHQLAIDSRKVSKGALFFAYKGSVVDGRDFILDAQENGAAAIVYDDSGFELPSDVSVPAFSVAELQSKVGIVAHEFFGRACDEMQIFGVTGTNGKTTCCYLLTQALTHLGLSAAMIGTIGVGKLDDCLLYTSPSPRDKRQSRMPSSA